MIDSHCHLDCLDVSGFENGLSDVLAYAKAQNVIGCLCIGLRHDTFKPMVSKVGRLENVWFSVGNHPGEVFEEEPSEQQLLEFAKDEDVIAIGETGLEYHYDSVTREVQKMRFMQHINVAREVNKPLIIHCRDAYEDVLDILSKAQPIKFVMHCFTGTWQQAQWFLELGGMISFSGIVTFKNAQDIQIAAEKVPTDRFLIETDCPYLAPVPFRGKMNQPGYLLHIAQKLAELKGIDIKEIERMSTQNFMQFFGVEKTKSPYSHKVCN